MEGSNGAIVKRVNRLIYLILAAGFALRLPVILNPQLDMESLWPVALRNASVADMFRSAVAAGEGPVSHIFFPLWCRLSINEAWIVLPAAIMNLAGVYMIYLAAKRWVGENAGLLASFLAATSPYMIHFSVRPRWEDIAVVSAAVSVYLTYEIIEKRVSAKLIAGYFFSTAIAIFSVHTMLFLWAAENLYFIIRRRIIWHWMACQAVILTVFLLWMNSFLRMVSDWTYPPGLGVSGALYKLIFGRGFFNIIDSEVSFFSGAHVSLHSDNAISRLIFFGSSLILLAAFAGIVALWRKKDPAWKPVFFLLIIQAACFFMVFFVAIWRGIGPHIHFQHMSGFAAAHFLLVAIGIYGLGKQYSEPYKKHMDIQAVQDCDGAMSSSNIPKSGLSSRRFLTISALCLYIVITTVSLTQYYRLMVRPNDFRMVLNEMKKREKAGDTMLVYPPFYMHVVAYYYKGRVKYHGIPEDHNLFTNYYGLGESDKQVRRRIASFTTNDRIWVLLPRSETELGGLNTLIPDELAKLGYKPEFEKKFDDSLIPKYRGRLILMSKK